MPNLAFMLASTWGRIDRSLVKGLPGINLIRKKTRVMMSHMVIMLMISRLMIYLAIFTPF